MPHILIGTSAFTAAGWEGAFYPEGMKPADYLHFYAGQFGTVEVDSTYYRIPSAAMVERWYGHTPEHFQFPYFNKQSIPDGAAFLARLIPFVKKLP